MTTTIEVTTIRPPKQGKKMCQIVDKDGRQYWAYPNVANAMTVGRFYDSEVEEKNLDGRPFRSIKKAKEVMPSAAASSSRGSDLPSAHATRPHSSAADGAEQAFVASVLNGALIGGHVKFEAAALAGATRLLQMLYSQSFGASSLAQYRGTQQ